MAAAIGLDENANRQMAEKRRCFDGRTDGDDPFGHEEIRKGPSNLMRHRNAGIAALQKKASRVVLRRAVAAAPKCHDDGCITERSRESHEIVRLRSGRREGQERAGGEQARRFLSQCKKPRNDELLEMAGLPGRHQFIQWGRRL